MGGKLRSVLFDAKNVPAFLLGNGKGIYYLDRDSYSFHEGGEGNPYNEYERKNITVVLSYIMLTQQALIHNT